MLAIDYWNDVAMECNRRDFSRPKPEQGGPTLSSRALGLVHMTMHDAHFGVVGGKALFIGASPTPGPSGTNAKSAQAAMAASARQVLLSLFPAQRAAIEREYNCAPGVAGAVAADLAFGEAVAARVTVLKAPLGAESDMGFMGFTNHGEHRPDPSNPMQGHHGPNYGDKATLLVTPTPFGLAPPPALNSPADLAALSQVYKKGAESSHPENEREPDETVIGVFWAYDGVNLIGTPPRLYNQVMRSVVAGKTISVNDKVSLYALVNLAMADAGVLAWREKYLHKRWRPVLGIREYDASMGPSGTATAKNPINPECDPEWLPFGAPKSNSRELPFTPPFPAYPSGHATFGAAAFQAIRNFLENKTGPMAQSVDSLSFNLVSDELNGSTTDHRGVVRSRHLRKFDSLWRAIVENGASRVYLGVHWVYDAFAMNDVFEGDGVTFKPMDEIQFDVTNPIGGVPLGLNIANALVDSYRANTHKLVGKTVPDILMVSGARKSARRAAKVAGKKKSRSN